MVKYIVVLHGCDDSTAVKINLTKSQAEALYLLEALCNKAGGGCQPTMAIYTWDKAPDYYQMAASE